MTDYTWPSVYFAYLFFFLSLGLALFFFVRSMKDGYWKRESEEIKLQVFEEEGGSVPRQETMDERRQASTRVSTRQARVPAPPNGGGLNHGTD